MLESWRGITLMTLAISGALLVSSSAETRAASITACAALNICYCINADNKDAIDANIARIRQMLADEHSRGKSIGYMSIPLSPAGGSGCGATTKDNIEKRFGAQSVWMLNPGAAGNLPAGVRRRLHVHVEALTPADKETPAEIISAMSR
jgi:hypothetical protein